MNLFYQHLLTEEMGWNSVKTSLCLGRCGKEAGQELAIFSQTSECWSALSGDHW